MVYYMQPPLHLLFAVELLLVGWNINMGVFNFDAYSHRTVFRCILTEALYSEWICTG